MGAPEVATAAECLVEVEKARVAKAAKAAVVAAAVTEAMSAAGVATEAVGAEADAAANGSRSVNVTVSLNEQARSSRRISAPISDTSRHYRDGLAQRAGAGLAAHLGASR